VTAAGGLVLLTSDRMELPDRLARRPELPVHLITTPRYRELHRERPRSSVVADWHDLTGLRAAALRAAATLPVPVTGVLAATEKSVAAAGLVRSVLGLPGWGYDQALALSHKDAMKRRLRAGGVPVARGATAHRLADVPRLAAAFGRPVIVKPVTGASARNVLRLDGPADPALAAVPDPAETGVPLLVEEHLTVTAEYHVDAVVRGGKVAFRAASRYFAPVLSLPRERRGSHLLTGPAGDLSGNPAEAPGTGAALAGLLDRVAAALGADRGVLHLECLATPSGLVAGEVAGRPGGGGIVRMLRDAYGVDLWDELISAELGEPAGPGGPSAQAAAEVAPSRDPLTGGTAEPGAVHAWTRVPAPGHPDGFTIEHFTAPTAGAARERWSALQDTTPPTAPVQKLVPGHRAQLVTE
jgi:biotin carboxylase